MRMDEILREAVRRQASDIMISAGAPLTYQVFGVLERDDPGYLLTPEDTHSLVYSLFDDEARMAFERDKDLDFSYHEPDVARFRVNAYQQRGTVAAVLRIVPLSVPHYSAIGISTRLLEQLVALPSGLLLVTGPTGAGKSTTVASLIEYLNTEHTVPRHIVTIEDPIEFFFPSKVCVIDQREIGRDTRGYDIGLRSALRQMPHTVFVGEMRDRTTMEIALTAAETGNLIVSTLSTQSAAKTINRIIDVFPLDDQPEIRARLALTLRAVIAQVLLRRVDRPGRIAAREILFVNSAVANLIREGKIHQINNIISSSYNEGMVLLDDSLLELQREGIVSAADVAVRLQDPERMGILV